MSGKVLVVGASGKFASLVIAPLVARKANIVGLIRRPDEVDRILAMGVSEAIVGDLSAPNDVARSLQGIEAVFYIAPAFMRDEAAVGTSFVAAAIAAGVRRFVFSSVIHPVLSGLSNHAAKAPVEAAVLDSDLEYSFLHPALFFQNYAGNWPKIVETGTLAEPWSPDTRFSRVDYRDVAEVAAIALTEDRLLYGTFELCADGWLDRHDAAELIGQVLGRRIDVARIDPDTLGSKSAPMRPMIDHYDHIGLCGNPLTLRAILGREPRTLRDYFAELAADEGKSS